jgi:hypothetical protein
LAGVVSSLSLGGLVAELTRVELQRLVRLGAKARLEELRLEEAAIRKAFPDLVGARARQTAGEGATPKRRRRGMSAAARKAVSARMKKYWAARRKAKAKGAGAK